MDFRIVGAPDPTSPSTLKKKLRSSLCCFTNSKSHNDHQHHQQQQHLSSSTAPTTPQGYSASGHFRDDLGLLRVSSASLSTPKSARSHPDHHHHHHEFSELKDKCRRAIGRMGRHSRRHSGDFKYDELSYALNFDHEDPNMDDDNFPLRNFSARLPHSPPTECAAASSASKEITGCS